jgi:DNA-binding beta-propeller fold protein YncE
MMKLRLARILSMATATLLLALLTQPRGANAAFELAWEAEGFDAPESVVLDDDASVLYLSNVNGKPTDADGNGYISKVSLEGKVLKKKWVSGLNAPKGLAFRDNKLYVADIDEVVVVDTKTGEILETHKAPGATFLNGVSIHKDGRVFVSDMLKNHIWLLEDGELSLWLETADLDHPNGVLAEDDRLLIATWGVPKDDFSTDVPGSLRAIDYGSKEVTQLGDKPIGNLDGLQPDGKGGFLSTDWFNGALFRISKSGDAEQVMDLNKGSADHLVTDNGSLVIIPMMLDGKLSAYRMR